MEKKISDPYLQRARILRASTREIYNIHSMADSFNEFISSRRLRRLTVTRDRIVRSD